MNDTQYVVKKIYILFIIFNSIILIIEVYCIIRQTFITIIDHAKFPGLKKSTSKITTTTRVLQNKVKDTNTRLEHVWSFLPAGIYLFKFNKGNTRTMCEICPKFIIKAPERRHWRRSGVSIVNFEHMLHLFLVFPCSLSKGRLGLFV